MKTVRLGKIAQFLSGGTPSKRNPDFWGGEYPWVSAKDMKIPIVSSSIDTLTRQGFIKAKKAPANSILILVRGMTLFKDVPICLAGVEVAFNQDLKALILSEDVEPIFLLNLLRLNKPMLMDLVDSAGHGTGRLDTEALKTFQVNLPPLPEQKAIAETLSTWDRAIEKLDRLIAAKENRFEGLVQELITDKGTRINKAKLGELCSVKKGQQLNVENMDEKGEYYALNGGVNPSGKTDKWNVESNIITISEGGNSCGYVNFNSDRFWCGGHCYALLNLKNEIHNHFLFFYLKGHQRKIMRLRVGSGLPNIQKKDLDRFIVRYPDYETQKLIAEVLLEVQNEITLLKKQADATRRQKRGLMQKLLTGEWRVNFK
jgi:type I restriction enzyme S subunit